MTPEDILSHEPRVLSQQQREFYFTHGYLLVERVVPQAWIDRLLEITANPIPSRYDGAIVRGKPARWSHCDPRPCLIPPDWSGGYTSLYALQQEETWAGEQLAKVAQQSAAMRATKM